MFTNYYAVFCFCSRLPLPLYKTWLRRAGGGVCNRTYSQGIYNYNNGYVHNWLLKISYHYHITKNNLWFGRSGSCLKSEPLEVLPRFSGTPASFHLHIYLRLAYYLNKYHILNSWSQIKFVSRGEGPGWFNLFSTDPWRKSNLYTQFVKKLYFFSIIILCSDY